MKIVLGYENGHLILGEDDDKYHDNPNGELEEEILLHYAKNFDKEMYVEHKSKNYSTLMYQDYDVIRFHYSNISKWIEIYITNEERDKYRNSSLFQETKNFNKLMWFSRINNPNDLVNFIDIVNHDLKEIDGYKTSQ